MRILKEYIAESSRKSKKSQTSFKILGDIEVLIKDPLPDNLDIYSVFETMGSLIPTQFLYPLDMIYIGQFAHLKDREVNAVYDSGAIYLSNEQDDKEDMLDDIVHEIAHMVEETHGADIYGDSNLEGEFLNKRIALERVLRFNEYNTFFFNFKDPDFSEELDLFFYSEVGYPILNTLSDGLFISPYAATSLREYFATGFEEYYLGDRELLSSVSPKLYNKIDNLNTMENNYD